jgi:hypothetical protein
VSGIIALAQSARGCNGRCLDTNYPARLAYVSPGRLRDVVSGTNGTCSSSMCIAGEGYDGATGMGTPKGIGAFMP